MHGLYLLSSELIIIYCYMQLIIILLLNWNVYRYFELEVYNTKVGEYVNTRIYVYKMPNLEAGMSILTLVSESSRNWILLMDDRSKFKYREVYIPS